MGRGGARRCDFNAFEIAIRVQNDRNPRSRPPFLQKGAAIPAAKEISLGNTKLKKIPHIMTVILNTLGGSVEVVSRLAFLARTNGTEL